MIHIFRINLNQLKTTKFWIQAALHDLVEIFYKITMIIRGIIDYSNDLVVNDKFIEIRSL